MKALLVRRLCVCEQVVCGSCVEMVEADCMKAVRMRELHAREPWGSVVCERACERVVCVRRLCLRELCVRMCVCG